MCVNSKLHHITSKRSTTCKMEHKIGNILWKLAILDTNIQIKKIADTIQINSEKILALEQKTETQEKIIYDLDKKVRKRILLLIGLDESNDSNDDLHTAVINFLKYTVKININNNDLYEVYRVGRVKSGDQL